ncbi:MAG: sensor domain-containing diguanylate cyclase, partial [Candidatus Omnitrophica bacterium]|nr:sensor domain-containing diguanylate cyclase [Candidatus Omnitrophota bacterium]
MDAAAAAKPPAALRWIVALILPLLCALLVALLLSGPSGTKAFGIEQTVLVETLCLVTMGLAVYAWVVYPPAGSLLISAVVFICLLWAWALRKASGVDLAAFGVLVGAAAWQQRRRPRRFLRMQQVIGDLNEERTVKDQAIAAASQTREALQKKHARYAQLQTIAEALSQMTDLAAIARLVVESAFRLIGKSDVCLLFLVDQERQELSLYASEKRESIKAIRAKHGDQFDRYVLRTHAPLLVNDVRRDFRFTVTVSPERDISSVIACPLLLGQSPGGVLRLDSSQPGVYTQDDLRFLDILLNLAGTAVTNAKLFAQTQQLAMTDGLTGLMLRRPFLEQLTRELIRSGRSRESVSVLMLDVDHFKQYNDTFGHTAGDLILKGVAEVLREVVPAGGLIARYGGEEFVVLLQRWPYPEAQEVA